MHTDLIVFGFGFGLRATPGEVQVLLLASQELVLAVLGE